MSGWALFIYWLLSIAVRPTVFKRAHLFKPRASPNYRKIKGIIIGVLRPLGLMPRRGLRPPSDGCPCWLPVADHLDSHKRRSSVYGSSRLRVVCTGICFPGVWPKGWNREARRLSASSPFLGYVA